MRTAVRVPRLETAPEPVGNLLERVADAGFDGVAFADLDESHLRPVATALGTTGLAPVAVDVSYDRLQAERRQVVRALSTIGCTRAVLPGLHEAYFADESEVARMATRLSALGGRLATAGRRLCYRNGSHEFRPVDRTAGDTGDAEPAPDDTADAFDLLVDRSGEGLTFALDVGGVIEGGRDPVQTLARLDGRLQFVHLHGVDGEGDTVTSGERPVDLEAVATAARDAGTAWLTVDYPDTDGSLPDAAARLAGAIE